VARELVHHTTNGFGLTNICRIEIADSAGIEHLSQCRVCRRFIAIIVDAHVPPGFSESLADGPTDPTGSPGNKYCLTSNGVESLIG
jgi:hypothetical protein